MPEDPDLNDDELEDSPVMKELREQAKAGKAEKERADKLERKLALSEAGLTGLTEEQREAISAVHKDEWNAEALKATADRLGFAQPPGEQQQQSQEPKVPQGELDAMSRVAQASGGTATSEPDVAARLAAATTDKEAIAILEEAGVVEH